MINSNLGFMFETATLKAALTFNLNRYLFFLLLLELKMPFYIKKLKQKEVKSIRLVLIILDINILWKSQMYPMHFLEILRVDFYLITNQLVLHLFLNFPNFII